MALGEIVVLQALMITVRALIFIICITICLLIGSLSCKWLHVLCNIMGRSHGYSPTPFCIDLCNLKRKDSCSRKSLQQQIYNSTSSNTFCCNKNWVYPPKTKVGKQADRQMMRYIYIDYNFLKNVNRLNKRFCFV